MSEVITTMSREEAQSCVQDVRAGIANVGRRLLDLYEGQGWLVLGYETWRDCAEKEFGFKQSRVYQLLESAEVNRNISTIVEKPVSEAITRVVAKAGGSEQQRKAISEAVATAPKDKDGKPKVTAKHVQAVVAKRVPEPPKVETKPEPAPDPTPETKPAVSATPWEEYNAKRLGIIAALENVRVLYRDLSAGPGVSSAFASWINLKSYDRSFKEAIDHLNGHEVIGWATAAQTKAQADGRNFLYLYETHKKRSA